MLRHRRKLLAALPFLGWVTSSPAQIPDPQFPPQPKDPEDIKLPNGKSQKDEILKADYERNLQDAVKLIQLSTQIKETLERNKQYVLPLDDLKRLEEIEKTAKRLRERIRRF